MSAFLTQREPAKPADNLEFATDKEVADRLRVKSERTIRRYKSDPRARQILGAIRYGKQWRIPKHQDWPKIPRELNSLGKALHLPSRIFRREMGWGNPRRERDTKILGLALDLERRRQKRRLTKKLERQLEQVRKRAQIIAAKHRCTVFNVPKFFRKYLEAVNERERKHNGPQIKWLKDNALWGEAKKKIKDGGGDAFFDVVEQFERDGKNISIPHRIYLRSVQTSAQLSRKVREFMKLWPSPEAIEQATARYNKNWWQIDLERGAKLLRQRKKRITVESLCPVLYRDEIAERQERPGISRSSYFRRRYSKADLARVRRVKVGNERRFEDLDKTDLANMSIKSRDGYELYNPFRDEKR